MTHESAGKRTQVELKVSEFGKLHRKCQQAEKCQGPGCKVKTGKTKLRKTSRNLTKI
jgi:hypothetical protein